MVAHNLEESIVELDKVLPPILFSVNADGVVSLTEEIGESRETTGSNSDDAKEFYEFLFIRGDLMAYIINVFRDTGIGTTFYIQGDNPKLWVSTAFDWGCTQQRSPYWTEVSRDWAIKLNERGE